MRIEFDPVKDTENQTKHDVSLFMANEPNRREVKHYVKNF